MKAQYISISAAARLVGKARETVMKAAAGLKSKRGPKNSKLYNAHALMTSIYCGNETAIWWQEDDRTEREMLRDLAKAVDRHSG